MREPVSRERWSRPILRNVAWRRLRAATLAPALALATATPEATAVDLSLEQAMEYAEQRAPQVRIAESTLLEAKASRAGAGVVLPANPRLFAEARAASGAAGWAATLEAPFELFGAPGARVSEADGRASAAQAEVDLERYLARYFAYELYVELRMSSLRLAESQSAIDLATRVVEASKKLVETGASSEIDLSVATASLAEFRAGRESLLAREQETVLPLRELLGLAPGTPVVLTTALDTPPSCVVEPSTGAKHPALRAIEAHLALGQKSLDRLEREVNPRMSFLLGVDAAPKSETYGALGVGVELPFAQRNQGPRAVTTAQLATDQTRLDLTSQRLRRELEARRAACAARKREADLLGGVALPEARKALQLVEGGWRAGKFDVFRVNTAARDVVRLGQQRIDVLDAAWKEHVAIQRLSAGGAT